MQVYHTPPTPKYVGDTFRKKKITDIVYSLFSSLPGQSTWQKQLKEGRIYVGSEFVGTVPQGRGGAVVGMGGKRIPCLYSQDVEMNTRTQFSFSSPWDGDTHMLGRFPLFQEIPS